MVFLVSECKEELDADKVIDDYQNIYKLEWPHFAIIPKHDDAFG